MIRCEVYSDVTGTGTGDWVGEYPTLAAAIRAGEAQRDLYTGYTVHEAASGKVRRHVRPERIDPEFMDRPDPYDDDYPIDGVGFADPGGRSALRASTGDRCPSCRKKVGRRDDFCRHCGSTLNPRKFPCPTCGGKDCLTRLDVAHRYQCDACADRAERGWD